MRRSLPHLPSEARATVESMLRPESLGIVEALAEGYAQLASTVWRALSRRFGFRSRMGM